MIFLIVYPTHPFCDLDQSADAVDREVYHKNAFFIPNTLFGDLDQSADAVDREVLLGKNWSKGDGERPLK
jgi:hypothetical protein